LFVGFCHHLQRFMGWHFGGHPRQPHLQPTSRVA
jgi:hypothetical protein